jgi:hypothetical protein
MSPALLASLFWLQTPVNIPAGYYTLADLGAKLKAQQVSVAVDGGCSEDVYAIRAVHESWPELRTALAADERLVIRPVRDGWRIERSEKDKTTAQIAARKYLAAAAASIHAVYEPVARIARELGGVAPEVRNARYEAWSAASGKDVLSNRIHDLVYLHYSGEFPYGFAALTSTMTAPGRDPGFGKPRTEQLSDWLQTILPWGSLRDLRIVGVDLAAMSDVELAKLIQSFRLSYLLAVDPLTLAAQASAFGYSIDALKMLHLGTRDLSVYGMPPVVKATILWDERYISSLTVRAAKTDAELENGKVKVERDMPPRSIRTSEALLRCADKADVDLVYHVPSFSDYVLPASARTSLSALISSLNNGKIDQEWLDNTSHELSGSFTKGITEPLKLPKRLSGTHAGGCLVIRNEMRFLDALSSSPAGAPSVDNSLLKDGLASFNSLRELIAKLNVPAWSSSLFSSNYLAYCNPLSFRPYAAAIGASPTLRRALASVADSKSVSVTFDSMEGRAKSAFIRTLGESALNREVSAIGAASFFDRTKEINLRIRISRSGNRYNLILEQALPSTFPERTGKAFEWDDIPRWSCWIQNVDCSLIEMQ